ncbi:cobalt ECF transporter T component CbiQ [Geobacter sp. OR-1]|uniref:cobalt ECF transporter T component CbiQ n=1 Tax=Geobacter sp. OR-1 TaxID=1266765 RepID=UPI0005AB89E4|nr:cobalt ECF transporter T component CbiQ [Geobacter sp. OR-1]
MLSIDGAILDFKQLDLLANGDSSLHRLDPRAKVLATLIFIISVVSFGKYELSALLSFFIFPAVLIGIANLPAGFILRKAILVLPFAFVVGLFNPVLDRAPLVTVGTMVISGGIVSWIAIMAKAMLTVTAALILVAITGFPAICRALEQMGTPQAFVIQLMFLYRYIFVLTEEAGRTSRARQLRACGKKGLGIASYGSMIGHLLLRTWQRAERVHMAMIARGFDGEFHTRQLARFGMAEAVFLIGWGVLFVTFRLYNLPQLLGGLITGILS